MIILTVLLACNLLWTLKHKSKGTRKRGHRSDFAALQTTFQFHIGNMELGTLDIWNVETSITQMLSDLQCDLIFTWHFPVQRTSSLTYKQTGNGQFNYRGGQAGVSIWHLRHVSEADELCICALPSFLPVSLEVSIMSKWVCNTKTGLQKLVGTQHTHCLISKLRSFKPRKLPDKFDGLQQALEIGSISDVETVYFMKRTLKGSLPLSQCCQLSVISSFFEVFQLVPFYSNDGSENISNWKQNCARELFNKKELAHACMPVHFLEINFDEWLFDRKLRSKCSNKRNKKKFVQVEFSLTRRVSIINLGVSRVVPGGCTLPWSMDLFQQMNGNEINLLRVCHSLDKCGRGSEQKFMFHSCLCSQFGEVAKR